jgi:hypothetical protein
VVSLPVIVRYGEGRRSGRKSSVDGCLIRRRTYEDKKISARALLWRDGGGTSRFIRHVELGDQDKITPGDPARSENTALRDAAEETSRQDQVKTDKIIRPMDRSATVTGKSLRGWRTSRSKYRSGV